ncbi:MAG TPA: TolC family protein [Candidatus Baltobacteraceae bacterium]|nr:TolC family protein [Candidatus Baltobacteraceae bacterium]
MRSSRLGAALVAAAVFVAPRPTPAANVPVTPPPIPAAAPLDLAGAVRYATHHDPTVLADVATVEQNESTFVKDHAAEFPTLVATLQNQVEKTNGANPNSVLAQYGLQQSQVYSQNLAQIGTNWNLYNGSLNQITAQSARRQVENARATLHRAEQQLAGDVARDWYAVVQDREAIRLADGQRAYEQQLLDAARAQERVGRVAGVDVLRAQADELRAEAGVTSALATEANARDTLAQRIGAPPETPFAFPVALPEPPLPRTPLSGLIALALAGRPDIAGAQANVAVAQLADAAIDTDIRPQLQLNGAFGNSEVPGSSTFPGFPPFPPNRPGFWQIGASETINFPLLDYGTRHAAHRAARAQIASAQAALDSTISGVENDVRQALRGVQTANANVLTDREAQRYGEESARIAQLQYRNGLISLSDATQAEQTALSAANDLVAAEVTYINAIVQLRASIGIADPVALVDTGVSE